MEWTKREQDKWHDGEDITDKKLMVKAEMRYKEREDEWNTPSAEQQQIVVMQAQIQELLNRKAPTNPKKKLKEEKPDKDPKADVRKKPPRQRVYTGDEAWRNVPPGPREPHVKTVNGRETKWCKFHKNWASHGTDACFHNPENQKPDTDITAALAQVGIHDVLEEDDDHEGQS